MNSDSFTNSDYLNKDADTIGTMDRELTRVGSPACSLCLYYTEIPGTQYGTCHRYPQALTVADDYWCGEWTSLYGKFETK